MPDRKATQYVNLFTKKTANGNSILFATRPERFDGEEKKIRTLNFNLPTIARQQHKQQQEQNL